MKLALAIALSLGAADGGAPDAGEPLGLVLHFESLAVPFDGGTITLAPAYVLDGTAGLRLAREVAAARAEIPALRANPPPLPGWAVVLLTVGFGLGFGAAVAADYIASEGAP